jgi:FMN phosphatase YigB (HAD superfamily)
MSWRKTNLIPEETLLIDDSLPNIETARTLGMKTLHVNRNQEKIEILINGRN